ncbi:DUF6527 family protein [Gelidibacter sp. F63206]|uniref:DUF6527 family protein n=1 Tax=Gelidibacter sp. F63206 TaxID=2926425 RepID=UPI001FF53ABE|nr:DUF6527 family protein [Gelidibacter sp. F63206]MCK0115124.1 hypothetical protein [Gelidibacter sp. F63206]
MKFKYQFVEFMPDVIQERVIYISLEYKSVIHKCACGCGEEVNTPLHPTGWKMIYNGEDISLKPSVGNWSFDCKSHYWIINSKVEWSLKWSDETILRVRRDEDITRQEYYRNKSSQILVNDSNELKDPLVSKPIKTNWIQKFLFWK